MGAVVELRDLPLKTPPGVGHHVSNEDLLRAATLHLCGGSIAEVCRALGVDDQNQSPFYIFASSEWIALCNIVLPRIREAVIPSLTSLESKIVTELRDRIENGDDLVNFEGKVVCKRRMTGKALAESYAKVSEVKRKAEERIAGVPTGEADITLKELLAALKAYGDAKQKPKDITGEATRT